MAEGVDCPLDSPGAALTVSGTFKVIAPPSLWGSGSRAHRERRKLCSNPSCESLKREGRPSLFRFRLLLAAGAYTYAPADTPNTIRRHETTTRSPRQTPRFWF